MDSSALNVLGSYIDRSYKRRKLKTYFMYLLLFAGTIICVVPLFSVFSYVAMKGAPSVNWQLITELPKPVGETGGGIANAFLGTLILVFFGSIFGVAWGILCGIYLAEFSAIETKSTQFVKFAIDLLASVPSIVVGLFVYAMVVKPMGHFSTLAGSIALGILMIPIIARNTEEILRMTPNTLREAGLGLGLPRWKVIFYIIVKGNLKFLFTGIMLSVARASGETAPLLFTAFGNQYWSSSLLEPMASIPVQIYTYAISPYDEWHRLAWASAFLLITFVLLINLGTRILLQVRSK